ncbi:MAG: hypothetical protein HYY06_20700 [Deltaproteobacteria bacterium]|nr:hypothetical protein [Deltaproteobacteria bacterium]
MRETRAAVEGPERELDEIARLLQARYGHAARIHSPMRTAAASVLTFCLAGASSAGCACGGQGPGPRDASAVDAGRDAGQPDSDVDAARDCSDSEIATAEAGVRALVASAGYCVTATVTFDAAGVPEVTASGAWTGEYCPGELDGIDARLQQIFSGRSWPCLARRSIVVEGNDRNDRRELMRRLEDECMEHGQAWGEIRIVVGPDGTVAQVVGSDGVSTEALDCVRAALDGLVFPCLANREICPEYVIIE